MSHILSTESLARLSTRRPWLVVGIWVVALVVGAAAAARVGTVLTNEAKTYDNNESDRAARLIEDRIRGEKMGQEFVVVRSESATADDAAFAAFVSGLASELRSLDGTVAVVVTPAETGDPSLISNDRHAVLVPVVLQVPVSDAADAVQPVLDVVSAANGRDGFSVLVGGDGSINQAFSHQSDKDLQTAEVVGLPVAIIVLLVVFGALVAAGLPVALGLLSIVVAIGLTTLVGQFFELSIFVVNMVTMIGLAVGIDYSLVIVQRFREERAGGALRDDAITTAGATAARAVLFSGLTVVVALSGLFIVPDSIYRSLAVGAVAVVVVAVAAAMTLLPAVLRLLGDRVDAIRVPFRRRRAPGDSRLGFWGHTTRWVTGHAVVSVVVAVGILVAAAAPYLAIELGFAGVSSLPNGSEPRAAFEALQRDFNVGVLSPTEIVVTAPDVREPAVTGAVEKLKGALASDSAFGPPQSTTNDAGTATLVSAPVKADFESDEAFTALHRVREQYIPAAFAGTGAEALVTGRVAFTDDYRSMIDRYTPIVFAFVLGLSFVILMVVFHSIVVPMKAMVMNLLSVGAAYGLMVLVFQEGVGNELFGFNTVPRIEAWVPLFMFAVLFGLSMDYHVFLLSRIRERWEETRDNLGSVVYGVRATAGMITGAALIMVSVFSGFAAGQLVMFQQMGFGLAVAVILDATLVRTVLVPASMALLGDLNWYLPSWLGWLPRVRLEGRHLSPDVYGGSPAGGA